MLKNLLELFFMPIKIFLYEFMIEFISKISLKFILKNEVLTFKNNVCDECLNLLARFMS